MVRDALTIIRLTHEVPLTADVKARCIRFAEAFLDENLPRMKE